MDYERVHSAASAAQGSPSLAVRFTSWLKQFWLLLWKNYKLQKRSLIGTVLEIAVPALFAFILMPIRRIVKSDQYLNDTVFKTFDVESFDGGLQPNYLFNYKQASFAKLASGPSPYWCFGYQPNNSTLIEGIMKIVADKFLMDLVAFADEKSMVDYLMANENTCLGGVSFLNQALDNFTYSLRYSYSPRNSQQFGLFKTDLDWKTNLIYPLFPVLGPREKNHVEGGDPGYFREGFMQIQKAIDFALIGHFEPSIDSVNFLFKRFPYPPYNDDKFVVVIQALFPFIIMLSFVFTVILTAKAIVYEKETGIKEAMKLMGMKPWIYWLSWYIKTFILLLPSLIFMIIAYKIKVNLTHGGSAAIIDKTDPILFTLFMFLYASTTITFTFLCTTFFKKGNSAAAGAGVIWFFSYLPYIFISLRYEKMTLGNKLMAAFVNNLAMSEGIQLIGMFEGKGVGINFNNWTKGVSVDDDFSLFQIMVIMVIDNFIHLILLYYFENLLPGDHGIARPWYFPFQPLINLKNKLLGVKEADEDRCNLLDNEQESPGDSQIPDPAAVGSKGLPVYIEDETNYSATRNIGIRICNLFKSFKQLGKIKQAVNNLSLNIYEGQITVLLGHNGAGKSTTISMITGLAKPDGGNILINDIDIVKETQKARSVLGYCPQHNLLFDDLTVMEHLEFFSKLKQNYNREEIVEMLEMLNLYDKKDALSKTLSGGMKRKLSVAIAFIGGSKIVILDEPSSGMDPQARHSTWSLLQKFRKEKNCTILLTTHFMDEADILGDRIAIMSKGSLKCCGSPLYLKSKYGSGYNLVLTRQRQAKIVNNEEKEKMVINRNDPANDAIGASTSSAAEVVEQADIDESHDSASESEAIRKLREAETKKIIELIESEIPNATLNSNINSELSFMLPSEQSGLFAGLFEKLEARSKELNILSIGISVTTVEEVFLKIGDDENCEDVDDASHAAADASHSNGVAPQSVVDDEIGSALWVGSKPQDLTYGMDYVGQQFLALTIKRIIHTLRNKVLIISQLIIPVAVIIINLVYLKYAPIKPEDSPPLPVDIDRYTANFAPYFIDANASNGSVLESLGALYGDQLNKYANVKSFELRDVKTVEDCAQSRADIDDFLKCLGRLNVYNVVDYYIVAATFSSTPKGLSVVAHFNDQPYHVPTLTLNLISNVLLRHFTNSSNHTITTINHPLPRDLQAQIKDLQLKDATGFNVASGLTFGFSFLIASFAMFLIKERVSDAKHLQYMSGADSNIFWISALLWDMLNYIIPVGFVVICLKGFGIEAFVGEERSEYVLGLLIIYGLAHIPQMYLLSYFFKVSATGFAVLTGWNILSSQATLTPTAILTLPQLGLTDVANILEWVFTVIFPNFGLGQGLLDMYNNYQVLDLCKNLSAYCLEFPNPCCNYVNPGNPARCGGEECLDWNDNYMGWRKPGLLRFFVFMPTQFLLQFIIILMLEGGTLRKLAYELKLVFQNKNSLVQMREQQNQMEELFGDIKKDQDVISEENRISTLVATRKLNPLIGQNSDEIFIIDRLTKHYANFMAVKGISFSMEKSECFGLLGVNGAGKTTSFKMITGDEFITNGDAYLNGVSVKSNIQKFQQQLGYCPQFDPLIDQMTVLETMYMYARLRGIRSELIHKTCLSLIQLLDLSDHIEKMCYTLSGGNKRKLSVAISLIGSPCVVLLDEPTSGMDPKTRRTLWNCLNSVRNKGKSLILTTHSMDETEALCTNIGIMVNGELKCLGSLQHLKSVYGEGYSLLVKINTESHSTRVPPVVHGSNRLLPPQDAIEAQENDVNKRAASFIQFILANIKNSHLKENRDGYVNIHINNDSPNLLSNLFSLMEKSKGEFAVEHYLVTQTKLEQIFLNFASKQIDPESRLSGGSKKKCKCCSSLC